VLKASSE
jgi:hypothetical protein